MRVKRSFSKFVNKIAKGVLKKGEERRGRRLGRLKLHKTVLWKNDREILYLKKKRILRNQERKKLEEKRKREEKDV